MKKTITLLALMVSVNAMAQCTFMMPMSPGHIKITSDQTITSTGALYWICDGVHVIVASSLGSTFVLEEYATITFLDSDGDQVYAKDNCVVTNSSAGDVGVTMNPSTVTINNTGSGSIFTTASCAAVTYDYMLVGGSSGCSPVTGVFSIEESNIKLFPNPATSQFVIEGGNNQNYTMVDVLGNVVLHGKLSSTTKVNCEGLSSGIYFVRVGNTLVKLMVE